MDYLTTTELTDKWKISSRRIQILCKEGRIDGAILKGNTWLIPSNAQKPEDLRKVRMQEKDDAKLRD